MAVRRMFSKTIMLTDKFTDMSVKAQLLYYNLNLEADDDGFISNPKRLLRSLDATVRQYNELIDNGYIISFDSGVAVICHWRLHNQIRKDRHTPTTCHREMDLLVTDENNVYIMATKCQPTVAKTVTEPATQVSIGKDSIGQVSLGECIGEEKKEKMCRPTPPAAEKQNKFMAPISVNSERDRQYNKSFVASLVRTYGREKCMELYPEYREYFPRY